MGLDGGPAQCWSTIAVLVCLCDLILTYGASSRFSLGWYVGRSMTLVAAAVVLVAMLAAFQRVKARAEHDASTDQLTGLQNRRSAYEALEQMVGRSHRSGAHSGYSTWTWTSSSKSTTASGMRQATTYSSRSTDSSPRPAAAATSSPG